MHALSSRIIITCLLGFAGLAFPTFAFAAQASGWISIGDQVLGLDTSCGPNSALYDFQTVEYSSETPVVPQSITVQIYDLATRAIVNTVSVTGASVTGTACLNGDTQAMSVAITGGANYYDFQGAYYWQENATAMYGKRMRANIHLRPRTMASQDIAHFSPVGTQSFQSEPSYQFVLNDIPPVHNITGIYQTFLYVQGPSGVVNRYTIPTSGGVGVYTLPPRGFTAEGTYYWGFALNLNGTSITESHTPFSGFSGWESFRVDRTPPTLSVSVSPGSPTSDQRVQVSAVSQDTLSGLESVVLFLDGVQVGSCSYSGTTFVQTCTAPQYGPYVAGSVHTYYAVARDRAGNVATTGVASFTVSASTLFAVLTPNPSSGTAPLSTTLSAVATGTAIADLSDLSVSYDSSESRMYALTVDSTNGTLYAGAGGTIYRCRTASLCDAGSDWSLSLLTSESYILSLTFDPTNGILYAGSGINGMIYRCNTTTNCDAGGDWTVSYDSLEATIRTLNVDVANGILYAGSGNNGIIYRCVTSMGCDAGSDWTIAYDTPETSIFSFTIDSINGVLYAGSSGNGIIYRCATGTQCDAASDWTIAYDTVEASIYSMVFDPANGVLYAGSGNNGIIYRCNTATNCDGASDWTVAYGTSETYIRALAIDPVKGVLFAGTWTNGLIYRCATASSCDAASDWTLAHDILDAVQVLAVDVSNSMLYIGATEGGIVYRAGTSGSANYSFWWDCANTSTNIATAESACGTLPPAVLGSCVSNSNGARCNGMMSRAQAVNTIYNAAGGFTPKVIVDTGGTISAENRASVSVTAPTLGITLTPNPQSGVAPLSTALTANTTGSAVENLSNWTVVYDTPEFVINALVTDTTNNVLYAGTSKNGIIYRCSMATSCDVAGDWAIAFDTPEQDINSLVVDSVKGVLYAGAYPTGIIYRCVTSTGCDAPSDWTIAYDTPEQFIYSLTFDSSNRVLYAGTYGNGIIYRCDTATNCDNASDWTISFDTPGERVNALAVDVLHGVLYAGVGNTGIIYRCNTATGCDVAGDWIIAFDTPELFIFSLALDAQSEVLYVGTGPNGIIYRCVVATACDVPADWTIAYDSPEPYIGRIAIDSANGVIYAGSSGNALGLIYQCALQSLCDAANDWRTSYDPPGRDVNSLIVDPVNSMVYAGVLGIIYRTPAVAFVSSTLNYHFWWNCNNTTTSVAGAVTACGSLPPSSPGVCVSNGSGARCSGMTSGAQEVLRTYPVVGTSTPKVIVEAVSASNAEARTIVVATQPPPTVITLAPTAVTPTGATLWGNGDPNGASTVGWFRFSTTNPGVCNDTFGVRSPSSGGEPLGAGTTGVNYSRGIVGLTADTTYYYCAIAINSGGIAFGSVVSFTALPAIPDLMIFENPTLSFGVLIEGNIVDFKGTIGNGGAAEVTTLFNNRFEIDLNNDGSIDVTLAPHPTIASLAPGAGQSVTSGSWTAISGTHRVILCADQPTPVVAESSETNNCNDVGTGIITVLPPPSPLDVSLTANPITGQVSFLDTLTASVSGTATGNIDYYFWWDCNYVGTDILAAEVSCGPLENSPTNGICNTNSNGSICPAIPTSPRFTTNTYTTPGNLTPMVIVERAGFFAQATTSLLATPPPTLSVSPTFIDFGNTVVGTTKDRSVTITNIGGGTLTGSMTFPAGPFSCSAANGAGCTFSLTGGQSVVIWITFAPTSIGQNFSATIPTSSNGGSQNIVVTGDGVPVVSGGNLDFGRVPVNTNKDMTLTITNNGALAMSGTLTTPAPFSCVFSSAGMSGSLCNYSIPPGGTNTFTMRFRPPSPGPFSGTASLSGTPSSTFLLTGVGYIPFIKFKEI